MKRLLVLSLFIVTMMHAQKIRIVTPYVGSINNQLAVDYMDDMEDSALLGGLFFQCVNPAKYQWNVFLYQSKDINESDILGSHFIFDYYLTKLPVPGKFVIGAGFDFIQIKTDINALSMTMHGQSATISDFKMTNNVYAPYFRTGRYLDFGNKTKKVSIFPWAGYEQDIIRGDINFNMPPMGPGGPTRKNEDIKSDYDYALLGLNTKVTLYHFIELSAKYYRKFSLDDNDNLNTFSGMLNLYLNRHWGLSYRFKYMEVSVSTNTYHMGGIAYIF